MADFRLFLETRERTKFRTKTIRTGRATATRRRRQATSRLAFHCAHCIVKRFCEPQPRLVPGHRASCIDRVPSAAQKKRVETTRSLNRPGVEVPTARKPFVVAMLWSPWGSSGEYRRRRAAWRCSHVDRHFSIKRLKKRGSARTARRRRHSPFDPHGLHGVTTTKEFRALARPPSTLRTPFFACLSRQNTTPNIVFWESAARIRWRRARRMTEISHFRS